MTAPLTLRRLTAADRAYSGRPHWNHLTVPGPWARTVRIHYRALRGPRRSGAPAWAARGAIYDMLLASLWGDVKFHPAPTVEAVA